VEPRVFRLGENLRHVPVKYHIECVDLQAEHILRPELRRPDALRKCQFQRRFPQRYD
jgi:hypothetical protein